MASASAGSKGVKGSCFDGGKSVKGGKGGDEGPSGNDSDDGDAEKGSECTITREQWLFSRVKELKAELALQTLQRPLVRPITREQWLFSKVNELKAELAALTLQCDTSPDYSDDEDYKGKAKGKGKDTSMVKGKGSGSSPDYSDDEDYKGKAKGKGKDTSMVKGKGSGSINMAEPSMPHWPTLEAEQQHNHVESLKDVQETLNLCITELVLELDAERESKTKSEREATLRIDELTKMLAEKAELEESLEETKTCLATANQWIEEMRCMLNPST
jgi:hypothetical protein